MSEKLYENTKLFWKEVKKESEVRDESVTMKSEGGVLVSGKNVESMESHFECLINEKTVWEAVVSRMNLEASGKQMFVQRN